MSRSSATPRTISLDRLVNYLKSKGGMEQTDAIAIDDFPFEARAWGVALEGGDARIRMKMRL